MGFEVGNSGRPKGVPNKISTKFAETMRKHGFNVAEELLDRYNDARQNQDHLLATRILIEMAQYVYPKLKSIDMQTNPALEGMTTQQKLEAFREAVKMLEIEAKKDDA
jgi:hypothetical protein